MSSHRSTPALAGVGRLLWILIGPPALIIAAFGIVSTGRSWFTGLDLAFFVILAAMLLGRWLEFRSGVPQTATGKPATPQDFQRYLVATCLAGIALWAVANLAWQYWPGP